MERTSLNDDLLVAHEMAARAVGRLDYAASVAPPGPRALLALRAMAKVTGRGREDMIALLRPDGEGRDELHRFARAFRSGASRARAGVVPTMALLTELAGASAPTATVPAGAAGERPEPDARAASIDAIMREPFSRVPPVFHAVQAGCALLDAYGDGAHVHATLACAMLLCVGGATADAWLAPSLLTGERTVTGHEHPGPRPAALEALAAEARAAELGLAQAQGRLAEDEANVRRSFGRAAYSALDVLSLLARDVVLTVSDAAHALGQTIPTTGAAVARLTQLGIAHEVTGRKRSRCFVYAALVDIMAPPLSAR